MQYNFDEIVERRGTNSVKWDMGEADLLPMWVADMDFKSPKPVIDAVVRRAEHGIYGYSAAGDRYYSSIINWWKKRHDWEVKKDWLVFSPGVVPAINMLVKAYMTAGDKVLVQTPVYYPFFSAAKNNGCFIEENPLIYRDGDYSMDFEDLKIKTSDPKVKLMILCSPHNPVGRVWTKEELTMVGEICTKNNVLVIADEIHCDLVYREYRHIPFASISEDFAENSITCIAPSKTFNIAGLQTSMVIISDEKLRLQFQKVLSSNGLMGPGLFGIEALTAAYEEGEEWLEQLLDYLKGNLEYLKTYIKENIPEIAVINPQGTYLAWVDCSKVCSRMGIDTIGLHDLFLKKGKVWFDEGHIFGTGGGCFERINIACPRSVLREGLERMKNAVKTQ